MTKFLNFALVIVILAAAIAAGADTNDGIEIEYKFRPDQVLRYKVSMTSTTTVQGVDQDTAQIPLSLSGVLCRQAKNILPSGDAEIVTTYETLKIEMLGTPVPVNAAQMPAITTTLSTCGQVKKVDGLDKLSGTAGVASQLASVCVFATNLALPTSSVKVGDKWIQDVAFGNLGAGKTESLLAVADDKSATIKQSLTGDVNLANTPLAAQLALGEKGTLSIDGDSVFSTSEGYLLTAQSNGTSEIPMSADSPTTVKLITKFDVSLELMPEIQK